MKSILFFLFAAVSCLAERAQINPVRDGSKCLAIDGELFNGAEVALHDCVPPSNGNFLNQLWTLNKGSTAIQLDLRPDFPLYCLDAGSNPGNGTPMKVWQCSNGLAAQNWYWTSDYRMALDGTGQCLDVPNGNNQDGQRVQIWKCKDNGDNQVWATTTWS